MDKIQKKRTDILEFKSAEEFVNQNTDYIRVKNLLNTDIKQHFVLLKLNNSNDYMLAKVKMYQGGLFSDKINPKIVQVSTSPLQGNVGAAPSIISPEFTFGVNVKDINNMHYFSDELYDFKNEQDRQYFERFCLEVGTGENWQNTLDQLAPYFKDRNFVLMAKDKAFELAFKIGGSDLTTIGKNLLEAKVKREIDKRVKKFASTETFSGEKEY